MSAAGRAERAFISNIGRIVDGAKTLPVPEARPSRKREGFVCWGRVSHLQARTGRFAQQFCSWHLCVFFFVHRRIPILPYCQSVQRSDAISGRYSNHRDPAGATATPPGRNNLPPFMNLGSNPNRSPKLSRLTS